MQITIVELEAYHPFTHVLVNNPTMGYGIFLENMLHAAGQVYARGESLWHFVWRVL